MNFAPLSRSDISSRARYFREVGVWPALDVQFDIEGWLSNFRPDEEEYATSLLGAFMYLSSTFTRRMFESAFQGLSRGVVTTRASLATAQDEWQRFIRSVLVVRVTGEMPSEADSGYHFVRMARDWLGIPEERLVSHASALHSLLTSPTTPVVFVDDFAGSGNQFIATWERLYLVHELSVTTSFKAVVSTSPASAIYYIPLICTQFGRERIENRCQGVRLGPVHILDERYDIFHPDSLVWPERLKSGSIDFINTASLRAGIPASRRRGFFDLGLALAFEHGVPDATVPLFYWRDCGWKPLMKGP